MNKIRYYNHGKAHSGNIRSGNFLNDEVGHWEILYGKSFRFFSFYIYWEKYSFWFRLFGYGIKGKNMSRSFLLFSERNNLRKSLKLFNWSFRLLKPNKI